MDYRFMDYASLSCLLRNVCFFNWVLVWLGSSIRTLFLFHNLEGPMEINMSEIQMSDIHQIFDKDSMKLGGHWKPKDCVPRWKVWNVEQKSANGFRNISVEHSALFIAKNFV